MEKKILIVGAGPTGLGAAYRLRELGYQNFTIIERNSYIGGLSASFKDEKGFTWDIGGHVIHSHFEYFDKVFYQLLKGNYLKHLRDCHIWILNRFVPYPFQNNIRHLPQKAINECLAGLKKLKANKNSRNFHEWVLSTFGKGIAKYFMLPYNQKVWSIDPKKMDKHWIAERVSVIDYQEELKNINENKDETNWGPNNYFLFPEKGGTGGFADAFYPLIKKYLKLDSKLKSLDLDNKVAVLETGEILKYDVLINTSPLDVFVQAIIKVPRKIRAAAKKLAHNNVCIVGIGLKGAGNKKRSWTYFPEKEYPFYRVTHFSNYSPSHTPGRGYFSLMSEISYALKKPIRKEIIDGTIKGLKLAGFISSRDTIVSRYIRFEEYAYPIPTLKRDENLKEIFSFLEENGIYSRGRFGAYKYEIGNMDHAFMQGVEVVDRILVGKKETVFR